MKINKGSVYVARVLSGGLEYWTRAMRGDNCSSITIKRTTVKEVGLFLASFVVARPDYADSIEVFELAEPELTLSSDDLAKLA